MNKFKLQLIGTLSALIAVIVLILAAISYNSFRNESIDLHKELLRETNAIVDAALTEKIVGFRRILSSVSVTNRDILGEQLSDHAVGQLSGLYKAVHDISDGIFLITNDGSLYNKSGEKQPVNVKQLNRSYFNAVFNQGKDFYMSAPYKSAITGQMVMAVILKINSSLAVLANINTSVMFDRVSAAGDMFVYTPDGTILAAPYPELIQKNIYSERPLFKDFSASNPELNYSAKMNGEDVDFTAFWGTLDITGWHYASFVHNDVN